MILDGFYRFIREERIYTPDDIEAVCDKIAPYINTCSAKKIRYLDIPASFDIETSNFIQEKTKIATMYVWQLGLYGCVIVGRTWSEYHAVYDYIVNRFHLHDARRLIVYVHNLAFEFAFLAKHHTWLKVFAAKERTPIYAATVDGIEFRCSYLLSGYNLDTLAKNLRHPIRKLVGDLDYRLRRHSKTPLSETELDYCVHDVKIVMIYIAELGEREKRISSFPLTKTGFVRRYCRSKCFETKAKRGYYTELMQQLTLTPDEYTIMKRAFMGGFTHASPFWVGDIIKAPVTSLDFTSSYPAVMIAEKYPMSRGERYVPSDYDDFENSLRCYCCIFDVKIIGLEPLIYNENYISSSRCRNSKNIITSNGRVVKADEIQMTITEVDYFLITKYYKLGGLKVCNMYRYKRDYLPTDFVKAILDLYRDKTSLKNVEGKEEEYLNSKEMVNATYGMSVTDIVRPVIDYKTEWTITEPDLDKEISKYNKNRNRFTFYAWGVYITAYARRNLFTGIYEFRDDYIYSDTDSIKVLNIEKHMDYVKRYNDVIISKLENAMDYHGLPHESIRPKTIEGVEKPLGVWDWDGEYQTFKTLGAKRYLVHYSDNPRNGDDAGEYKMTVAGLNKKKVVPWMLKRYKNIFKAFDDDLHVPAAHSGKLVHTYIDEERAGVFRDYLGHFGEYDELSSVYLAPSSYDLSISADFLDYLQGIHILD